MQNAHLLICTTKSHATVVHSRRIESVVVDLAHKFLQNIFFSYKNSRLTTLKGAGHTHIGVTATPRTSNAISFSTHVSSTGAVPQNCNDSVTLALQCIKTQTFSVNPATSISPLVHVSSSHRQLVIGMRRLLTDTLHDSSTPHGRCTMLGNAEVCTYVVFLFLTKLFTDH